MGVNTEVYVVKKDGTALEVGTIFNNIQKAMLDAGAFSSVNVLGKKGFNSHMSTHFSHQSLISVCTVYYPHPEAKTQFRELADGIKYDQRGVRMYYGQHKCSGSANTPKEILDAEQFVAATLDSNTVGIDFMAKIAQGLGNLLPDHHVYFVERDSTPIFQKIEMEDLV